MLTNHGENNLLLKAEHLSCVKGENELFTKISLTLSRGECIHLVGPNGSGKTSLLRILCGLSRSETGLVNWRGIPLAENESYNREQFFLGHKDALKNELTAIENLRFVQSLERYRDEDQLDEALAQMQILHCADLPAQSLSFGQRRRLAFAKLLLINRTLWILDEPFTGIDSKGRELIENLCLQHLENSGCIILTHHQSLQNSALGQYLTELDIGKA